MGIPLWPWPSVVEVTEAEIFTELIPERGRSANPLLDVANEPRTAFDHRPWVYTNMVTTLDGGIAIDGRSGALGGPGDQAVFGALRAVADVILVGASTAVAEDYRPPGDKHRSARLARGQAERPTIAIITRSLSIEPTHRVFSDPDARPSIITVTDAPSQRRSQLAEVADIIDAGTGDIDLGIALEALRGRGHERALLEGGPTLNGQFLAADLIDEWNMTLSPMLAGGDSARAAHGPELATPPDLRLTRLWLDDDTLFGRWITLRPTDQSAHGRPD